MIGDPRGLPTKAVMDGMKRHLRNEHNPAAYAREQIVNLIREFEEALGPDEEVGLGVSTAGSHSTLHLTEVASRGNLIVFTGTDEDGRRGQLVQSHTQVSLLLSAKPKQKEQARRIGFLADGAEEAE